MSTSHGNEALPDGSESAALSVRRVPTTERGRATFDQILAGALAVLAEEGLEKLTTRRVVEETGVNISVLYQFFPNKEAILLAAFDRWAEKVLAALDRVEAEALGELELLPFLDRILAELHAFDMDLRVWVALHNAMRSYSRLVPVERVHARRVAERVARYMKRYGSPWREQSLLDFGELLYEFDCMMVSRLAQLPPERAGPTFELGRAAAAQLFLRVMQPEPQANIDI